LSEMIAAIPGAPAPGSPEDISDWETLKKLQKSRTAKDCKRATSEVVVNLNNFYGPPYGPLSKKEAERLVPFFEELSQLSYHPDLIGMTKKHWHRPRPYLAHPDLEPCVKKEPSFSYPSGHAAVSVILYRALSELHPKLSAKLLKRANQIAYDRTLAGVHYPTDIRDGKIIGEMNYQFMKATDTYQKLIAKYKAAK